MDTTAPPVPAGPDPIESDAVVVLRTEILRLRDAILGAGARTEVLENRIHELEAHVERLSVANEHLRADLARFTGNPALRAALVLSRPARVRLSARRKRP